MLFYPKCGLVIRNACVVQAVAPNFHETRCDCECFSFQHFLLPGFQVRANLVVLLSLAEFVQSLLYCCKNNSCL